MSLNAARLAGVYGTFPELLEGNPEELAGRYPDNDYGVPYRPPRDLGFNSLGTESEEGALLDSNQENQAPAITLAPQYGGVPDLDDEYFSDDEESGIEQYEELDETGIRELATKLGIADVDGLRRLAQSPQVFHEISLMMRRDFMDVDINFLDYAG